MWKRYKLKNITLPIASSAIDSGYNPKIEEHKINLDLEHVVYEFVATTPRTIACRGNPELKDMILKQEHVKRKSILKKRFDSAVSELKDETYLKLDYSEDMEGAIHFSNELPDEFFKGFVSEVYTEISSGKWAWKKNYERNEPLDTYILARGGAEYLNLPSWTETVWQDYERKLFI